MRKIIAGLFISLDGVVEAPQDWHFPYFNDEMGEAVAAQADAADTMLFGRNTFEEFAGFWPQQGSDVPFADVINKTPKVLVSTTLKSVEWGPTTIVSGDVIEAVKALKQQSGKAISITGSPTLVRSPDGSVSFCSPTTNGSPSVSSRAKQPMSCSASSGLREAL